MSTGNNDALFGESAGRDDEETAHAATQDQDEQDDEEGGGEMDSDKESGRDKASGGADKSTSAVEQETDGEFTNSMNVLLSVE